MQHQAAQNSFIRRLDTFQLSQHCFRGEGGAQNYELAKEQLFFINFSLQIRKFSNIMNMIVWIFMNLDLKLCANAYYYNIFLGALWVFFTLYKALLKILHYFFKNTHPHTYMYL